MRGDLRIIDDVALDEQTIAANHLVLFGDPGSNAVLKKILERLPIEWTNDKIRIAEREWSASDHGVNLIFPNPLNPSKYVVLNSGHTFHEKDFRNSNAYLFPRLGDIAVQRISMDGNGNLVEQVVWSDVFNSYWKLAPR
jgi:hypothetical protein